MTTDIRPGVVDAILASAQRAVDARFAGQPREHLERDWHARMDAATPAEQDHVLAVIVAEVADSLAGFDADWAGRPDTDMLAMTAAAGADDRPGLPHDMETVYILTARQGAPRRGRAVADAIIRNWTAERRAEYEQRTGTRLPADVPPPPAG